VEALLEALLASAVLTFWGTLEAQRHEIIGHGAGWSALWMTCAFLVAVAAWRLR
jgi:hypothetical protein